MHENSFYKVWIGELSGKAATDSLIEKLSNAGYHKTFIRNRAQTDSRVKKIDLTRYSAVIQVGAYASRENALRAEKKLIKAVNHPVTVIIEDGLYKVQISGFTGRIQAVAFLPELLNSGFAEAYVRRVKY